MGKAELEAWIATLDKLLFLFGAMVAVGVAGAAVIGVQHWLADRKLRALHAAENREQLAQMERLDSERAAEIAHLNSEIAKARERTAEAVARAAAANEKAEQERLARAQIEEKLEPRHLSESQQSEIASKLESFHRKRVTVFRSKQAPEIAVFANEIAEALKSAKWHVGQAVKTEWDRIVLGVLVEVNSEAEKADPDIGRAAAALVGALRAEGVAVRGPLPLTNSRFTAEADQGDLGAPIHVMVGAKP